MIPTITRYLYELQRNKPYLILAAERRRAIWLLLGIFTCLATIVLLWIVR